MEASSYHIIEPTFSPSAIIIASRRADMDLIDLPFPPPVLTLQSLYLSAHTDMYLRLNLFLGSEYARRPLTDAELADIAPSQRVVGPQHNTTKCFSEIKHDAFEPMSVRVRWSGRARTMVHRVPSTQVG